MFELFKTLLGSTAQATTLLHQAHGRFVEMLDLGTELLSELQPHLLADTLPDALAEHGRSIDKNANRLERTVRKLLVEHLAFGTADAPACLVLMSVAKDGERIIDECRNLLDIPRLLRQAIGEDYRQPMRDLAGRLIVDLRATRAAFAANDERVALGLVEGEKPFIADILVLADRVLDDHGLTQRQAVLISRAIRCLQRIRAHLGNIASTVVFPVHRIDFVKSRYIAEARQRLGG